MGIKKLNLIQCVSRSVNLFSYHKRLTQVLCLSLVSLLDAPMIFWRVKRGEVQFLLRVRLRAIHERWPLAFILSFLSSCEKFL